MRMHIYVGMGCMIPTSRPLRDWRNTDSFKRLRGGDCPRWHFEARLHLEPTVPDEFLQAAIVGWPCRGAPLAPAGTPLPAANPATEAASAPERGNQVHTVLPELCGHCGQSLPQQLEQVQPAGAYISSSSDRVAGPESAGASGR